VTQPVVEVAFLTHLGHALSVAGDPVSSTERALRDVAHSIGLSNIEIGVLPTLVFVRVDDGTLPTIDLAAADVDQDLRLDQVGALYDIVDQARLGQLSATDGLARLGEVWALRPRFGAAVRIVGQVILSIGLGLIITPRPAALAWCAAMGLLVGVLIELGMHWGALRVLMPVISSLVVSVIVFTATGAGLIVAPLLLLIPPLITFLPGGMLTTAMVELADHHPIAGASRLMTGAIQLLMLVFGIVAGQVVVGIPADLAFAKVSDDPVGMVGSVAGAAAIRSRRVSPFRWPAAIASLDMPGCVCRGSGRVSRRSHSQRISGQVYWRRGDNHVRYMARPAAGGAVVPGHVSASFLAADARRAGRGRPCRPCGQRSTIALLDLGRVTFTILSIALGVLVGVASMHALRACDVTRTQPETAMDEIVWRGRS
jgi:uncharacterized membrane protein YjjP (DUF1212 family)